MHQNIHKIYYRGKEKLHNASVNVEIFACNIEYKTSQVVMVFQEMLIFQEVFASINGILTP